VGRAQVARVSKLPVKYVTYVLRSTAEGGVVEQLAKSSSTPTSTTNFN
jgi:hypothetical protein